jgi:hypothetical protein
MYVNASTHDVCTEVGGERCSSFMSHLLARFAGRFRLTSFMTYSFVDFNIHGEVNASVSLGFGGRVKIHFMNEPREDYF